jgi:hypothetical protein
MRWYRSVWLCGTIPVAALGLFGAIVAAPMVKLVSLIFVVAIVAASTAWAWGVRPTDRVVATTVIAVSATTVAVGLGALLGDVVVVPLLVIAVLSPPVVAVAVRHLVKGTSKVAPAASSRAVAPDARPAVCRPRGPAESRTRQPARSPASRVVPNDRPVFLTDTWMTQPPTTMDGPALCLAWRKTSTMLRRELALPVVETLVRRRQDLLDEMERRNGAGFRAWLASGARAAGDPSRYIVGSSERRS